MADNGIPLSPGGEMVKINLPKPQMVSAVAAKLSGMNKVINTLGKSLTVTADQTLKFAAAIAGLGKIKSILDGISSSIFDLGKTTVIAAVASVESINKFEAVFTKMGASADVTAKQLKNANAVVDELAKSFGLADTTAKELLGTVGDLFSGLQLAEDQSLFLSKQVVGLAGNLASFQNITGGVEEATMRLTKGILGHTRNLRLLGITVRKTDDDFKYSMRKIQELTGVSKKAAEAMAILTIALKESPKAIRKMGKLAGDFAITMYEIAQQARIFTEAMKTLTIDVGKTIIEFFQLKDLMIGFVRIIKLVINFWKGLSTTTKGFILLVPIVVGLLAALISGLIGVSIAAGAAIAAFGILAGALGIGLLPLLGIILAVAAGLVIQIGLVVLGIIAFVAVIGKGDTLGKKFLNILDRISSTFQDLLPYIKDVGYMLGFMAMNAWTSTKAVFSVAFAIVSFSLSILKFLPTFILFKGIIWLVVWAFQMMGTMIQLNAGFLRNFAWNIEQVLDKVINLIEAIMLLGKGLLKLSIFDYRGLADMKKGLDDLKKTALKPLDIRFGDPNLRTALDTKDELKRRRAARADKFGGFKGGQSPVLQRSPAELEGSSEAFKTIFQTREQEIQKTNSLLDKLINQVIGLRRDTKDNQPKPVTI